MAAFTSFTNTVLAGLCPKEVERFFYDGRLMAYSKKSGIAVGVTPQCLASKCSNIHCAVNKLPLFHLYQLGTDIRGAVRQLSTLHALFYKLWPQTMLWLNLILPMLLTVCIDLTCHCLSETSYPSCMPFASYLIHNPHLYFVVHV